MENKVVETYKFPNRLAYLKALDSCMPDDYIQIRDLGGGRKSRYLPAPIKEAIADEFFFYWNVIDEDYSIIANEILCTVKLVYMPNYPSADEMICTGSAATPIQMESYSKVGEFPAKKKLNALEYNVPSVRTEAISNALGSLGNIFGRSLGRKFSKDRPVPNNFSIRKHSDEKED